MPPRNVDKAGRRYSVVALATEYRKFPLCRAAQQPCLFVGRVAGGHAWIADRVLLAHDPRALQQLAIDQLKAFRHGCPHLALHPLDRRGGALCRHAAPRFAGHRRFFRDAEKMGLDQNPRKTTLTLS
jgi:hypothetical protein